MYVSFVTVHFAYWKTIFLLKCRFKHFRLIMHTAPRYCANFSNVLSMPLNCWVRFVKWKIFSCMQIWAFWEGKRFSSIEINKSINQKYKFRFVFFQKLEYRCPRIIIVCRMFIDILWDKNGCHIYLIDYPWENYPVIPPVT